MMSLDIRGIMVAAPSAAYYEHINTRWWLLLCPTVASFEKKFNDKQQTLESRYEP
jgi:hypothetical protein